MTFLNKPVQFKLLMVLSLLSAMYVSASSTIIAGWHDFNDAYGLYKTAASPKSADEYLGGITASLYGGDGTRDTWGSTDGTYGVLNAVETSATDGSMSHRTDKPNMYMTLVNNTGSDAVLESVVFDLASVLTSSPKDITLFYDSGDLTDADNTQINSATGVNSNGLGKVSDYQDFDWSLAALSDQTLASGESAVFRLTVANAGNNVQALALDNIAIIGQGTAGDPLVASMTALKNHITGSATLTASQITAQADIFASYADEVGDSAATITQALDLVETYETEVGYLFNSGEFSRTDASTQVKALRLAMFGVYQSIIDDVYDASNLASHRALLDGYKFESADYFPGAVAPPADTNAVYSVQINASQPEAWGYDVSFQYEAARRPTGAYLAPGSIATVTVPAALVGKGYEIRIGAHVADLKNRPNIYKRLNRVSLTYPINSTTTEIASPLGGGIYIEVPYGIEEGLVTVEFKNTVRAPFYSNSSARQTTLSEWQNTERSHPGAWADFETDKFMLTVPTDWIYAYNDPVTLMSNWDKAMDACSDLQGLPRIRPKTVLYCIIDVTLDANVFSPGYPQSNDNYNPTSSAGGNKSHDYLNGPKFAGYHHLHEFGHAAYVTKFRGELEALVNFFYVPVHHRMFGVSLDEAFGRSIGNYNSRNISRDQAALSWILSENFQAGYEMDYSNTTNNQFKYQHRGYGKYVEIAGLFGWDALSNFWHSVAVDAENGTTYSRNSDPVDSRILRMSRAAGCDLSPLIHFWGIHPVNASGLKADILAEGLPKSALIYDRLQYYQSIVPMNAAGFDAHYQIFKAAGIKNSESNWYQTNRTAWNSTLGNLTVSRVQEIIDEYFPNGRPAAGEVQSLPYAESFETDLGAWVQSVADDYDWSLNSGYTETGNTGPSGASDGTQYLYLEGHDNGIKYKTASVECLFDLSLVDHAELTFDYHMYGTYIDYLSVDVSDGTTWTSNVWNRSNQHHFSSEAAWSNAVVDLTPYVGNDAVTIRFRGKQKEWHAADTAIDNITVTGAVFTPYEQWAVGMFDGSAPGTDQSATGNPDGDGLNNMQEWALVTDPMTADAPPMDITINDPNLIVVYERRIDSGLTVRAGWAESPTSTVWRLNGDGLTEVSIGTSGDVQTMAVLVPLDEDRKFIRLEVQ
ncbi:M60 family peptidase N-terminal accessory domain-containing protein [Pontiellaceae bacterium B12227]|nr:M60 family peptidase N-terminal accessory domain-containing protein [Pontiellaceae bacterium B12227]